MNKLIPLSLLFITYFACTPKEEREAVQLIEQAIEHHGGEEKWSTMQQLSFDKQTILYTESSEIESQLDQHLEFRLRPYFEANISWVKDSIRHRILFDGVNTTYFMGENEIKNESFLASKKREIDAAFYVMTKPFDLLEGEKTRRSDGLQTIPDGRKVKAVEVIDGPFDATNLDIWTYFFEPETNELLGYKVKTSVHTSMVYNSSWIKVNNILFPEIRESFRLDDEGNHAYLRAAYTYSNIAIQ